jgi:hypothetical protein
MINFSFNSFWSTSSCRICYCTRNKYSNKWPLRLQSIDSNINAIVVLRVLMPHEYVVYAAVTTDTRDLLWSPRPQPAMTTLAETAPGNPLPFRDTQELLKKIGLEKYSDIFQQQEVSASDKKLLNLEPPLKKTCFCISPRYVTYLYAVSTDLWLRCRMTCFVSCWLSCFFF